MGVNNTQAKIMGELNIISPETLIKALVKKVLKRLTDYKKKKTG